MTNSEALKKMQAIKAYMTSGNPIWSVTEIGEAFDMAIEALDRTEPQWIPCSERLPDEAYPVIVTWKNDDPPSYYQDILGKHYTGVAHFHSGKWFWYSSVTEDVLMEYGRCDSEEFDEAIQVLAWMPLPEPYRRNKQYEDD